MHFLQILCPINEVFTFQIREKGHQVTVVRLHRRALRHETISRHIRLRIRTNEQIPPGDGVCCVGGSTSLSDGGEIIGSEPNHDFCRVAGTAGAGGDEGVVRDVSADRVRTVAVILVRIRQEDDPLW